MITPYQWEEQAGYLLSLFEKKEAFASLKRGFINNIAGMPSHPAAEFAFNSPIDFL